MIILNRKIGEVEFDVEIALNTKLCILHWNGNPVFFEDVDLAQVIRAVKNSADFQDLSENIKGIWREEQILPVIKSFALDEIDADDFCKVLCDSDEWIKRKMNTLSMKLRTETPESDSWFKFRGMMYDCVIESGVIE